jgi:hypothetical protein
MNEGSVGAAFARCFLVARDGCLRRELLNNSLRTHALEWNPKLLHRALIAGAAIMAVLLLSGCANYPQVYADGSSCVPLYGGTLVTLPKAGYRMPDGGFIPMEELLVMRDGGVWKC